MGFSLTLVAGKGYEKYSIDDVKNKKDIVEVAIIGAGPAGLGSSIYTSLAKFHTVIFQGPKRGGQLADTEGVINWLGLPKMAGIDVINKLQQQTKRFGSLVDNSIIKSVDFSSWPFKLTTDSNKTIYALSVIIATGATPQKLNVKGEKDYWGKGVAGCTTCDALFAKNKHAAVVGGGNRSVEMALKLAKYAKSVKILVRREKLRASREMQNKLKGFKNISVLYNTQVKEIIGNQNHVSGVKIFDKNTKQEKFIPAQWIFLAIGHTPDTKLFANKLPMDNNGYITLKGRTQKTPIVGVFAAGNATEPIRRYRQSGTIAAAQGMKAATDVINFLDKLGFDGPLRKTIKHRLYKPDKEDSDFKVIEIKNLDDFERKFAASKKPILLEFYRPGCPYCMQMEPVVASVAKKYSNKINTYLVNKRQINELSKKFNVQVVPTFVIIKDNKEIAKTLGQMPAQKLSKFIDDALSKK